MRWDFDSERRAWNSEVDAEAARLIRAGVPPYDAVQRARDIVSESRKRKAQLTPEPPTT